MPRPGRPRALAKDYNRRPGLVAGTCAGATAGMAVDARPWLRAVAKERGVC